MIPPKEKDAINVCPEFIGALNEPHEKCKECCKEEWQHK